MQMPQMDGLTLARTIREQGAGRALPLVLLSSLGRQERARGANEFASSLTKPVKASQLYNALVRILAERAGEEASPPPEVQVRSPVSPRALRILIAEDNELNQKLALGLLAKLGYEADLVKTGAEAVEAVEREEYDVVLMDVQMPELDGLEATRRIRQSRPRGDPRIVAMTANALREHREACLAAGMDDYLAKPIRIDQLDEALERGQPPATAARGASRNQPVALDQLRAQFDDEAVVSELIETFLGEAPKLVAALGSDEPADVRLAAHTLKSNAQMLGAEELGRLCEELEELARGGALNGVAERIAAIEEEYARVERALRAAG
jgi:CheY-like chemotaxis protein/HPt (histidine-containing phosphotransfer) domain-containing protein